jgi:hypothetical protein
MTTDHGALPIRLILISSVAFTLPAVAEERETRELAGFEAVEVSGGIDLSIRQGESFRVEVSSDDLDDIVTEVQAGTLSIRRKRSWGFFDWGDHGSASVTLPKLVALTASGGSDVRSEGTFSGDALEIVASGGSDMALDVAVATLEVVTSGGSDLRLSGTARSAHVQSSGGSDLDASRLTVDDADVQSSGGSDLSIMVRERIVGNASGGSDIRYSGEPRVVNVNSSGGGDVSRR